jgi:hypothetical protein
VVFAELLENGSRLTEDSNPQVSESKDQENVMKRLALAAFALILAAIAMMLAAGAFAVDNEIPKEARIAFEKATEFEMYSLNPARLRDKEVKEADADRFHNWKILGKTTVKDDVAKKVRSAVEKGVKDSDGSVAACFNPRHGIRIVHEMKTYDLVICYECLSANVFEGDKLIGQFLTSSSPGKALTRILSDAKVPLP